jgi:hypothetical protein
LGRLAWSQLRFRAARTIALLAGVLLAATAFTVLTAASRTSQVRTVGTVTAHFSPAYDILVRPKGSRSALETRSGTVQPNFLSGIYGGISLAQYHRIQQIPGVQVAAPIAMVGYTLVRAGIPVLLPAADSARPGRQLYRYATTWVSAGGTIRVSQPPSFVYLTPDRLGLNSAGQTYEDVPGSAPVTVCPGPAAQPASPFDVAAQSEGWCWSHINGSAGAFTLSPPPHQAFALVTWSFPMLIAAVDPAAEAKLDGLNHAVTSGRYLAEGDGHGQAANGQPTFPVLAASTSGIGEYAITQVQRLPAPAAPVRLSGATMASEAAVPGQAVLTVRTTAEQAYRQVLAVASEHQPVDAYLTAGPVSYRRSGDGALTPLQVRNPVSVWQLGEATSALLAPPMDETESQYRSLGGHQEIGLQSGGGAPEMQLVGVFDPARIRAFDSLSQVPLGPFQATTVAPANEATRNALGGGDLLPNLNLGGYVSQPAQLITTLSALPALEASSAFSGNTHASDPISVIRVRVAGVTGPNPVSLERIREVAQQIAIGTGLDVDIVAGSSPEPTAINLPAGRYGQPRLDLREGWVKKGIAVAILTAVDKKSVVLFALVLVVCVLFVANSATAAVRSRRRELGVLACLGWRAHQPGGITALAVVNTMRAPGRSLIGVLSLAVGVAALTLLTAVTVAYRGVVVGSLLGDAVAVQVRGVDYVAVAATVALGVLAVADVVFLNIRERAAELATIRSFGWRESSLARLVVTEGAVIGTVGSLAGAAFGLAGAAEFAGQLPSGLFAAAGASAAAGVLVTAAAALLPARLLSRLPAAHLLAEE